MAVLQMQKVSICALKKDRKAILEKIQSMGVMEISRFESEEEGFQTVNTQEDRSAFEKNAALADTALNILQEYVPEKVSMFASLEGKDLIEKSKYLETAHREKEVLDMAAQVVKLHKQTAECKANVQKLENQIEALRPWMNLDIPGDFQGTETAAALIGSMTGSLTLEEIYSLILEQAPEVSGVDISILSSERDTVYLAAVCLKKDVEKVEEILRHSGFARPSQSMSKIPAREKEDLQQQITVLQQEMEECGNKIASYASEREKFKLISDYFRARAEKYQILGQLPQSKKPFLADGNISKIVMGRSRKQWIFRIRGRCSGVLWSSKKGRNRPHNADVLLLCVFLWIDAVRCSVWAGDVPGLFCDTEEVPAYGTVFEKIH